jgi:hypothetical protein
MGQWEQLWWWWWTHQDKLLALELVLERGQYRPLSQLVLKVGLELQGRSKMQEV